MTQWNRRRALPLLLAAVLGLLLGSVGTATAQGLTTKAVRKIATKVVKKQAGSLSVANSQALAGQPPSAYQERRQVFTFPIAATASFNATLPLGPGSYEVSYSAKLLGTMNTTSDCSLALYHGAFVPDAYYANDASVGITTRQGHSGLAVVTVGATQKLALSCSVDAGTFTTPALEPVQVVVGPVEVLSAGTGVLVS